MPRRKDWQRENTDWEWLQRSRGSCSSGKWQYLSRSAAKKSDRMAGSKMSTYSCPECRFWHVGHLPLAVKRGEMTRSEYYGRYRDV